jgi:hypothetical protein
MVPLQMLHFEDHAADAGIVFFHDNAVGLAKTQRLDGALLIFQASDRAFGLRDFQFHVRRPP